MKRLRWLWIPAVLVVLAVAGWWWFGGHQHERLPSADDADVAKALSDPAVVARGKYLTIAGDCAACHTKQGGIAFAGGRILPTPFGNIPAPNITPDPETGLGNWNFEDFWRALHTGVGRNSELLYPVFSYTSYTKVNRDDALAIYAYLRSLAPQHAPSVSLGLDFPYNVRTGLNAWRALYFKPGVFQADSSHSAEWNRGAYLVQGLGHCNECHVTRDALGGMKGDQTLAGGEIPAQNWYAPDLSTKANGGLEGWTAEDIVNLLKTGQSARGSAFGPMAETVYDSTQYLSQDDLQAIATYLQSLPARPKPKVEETKFDSKALADRGTGIYAQRCASCHGKKRRRCGGRVSATER